MERQVLMDKLSEFLMVEQGGLELYRVVEARASQQALKKRYQEFLQETDHHREVLVQLIERLGGDPNYISPTTQLAQVKAASLLETSICVDGLSPEEIEANDLENVLLAETKDHADWEFLAQLVDRIEDEEVRSAIEAAVEEVGPEEDEHLGWAQQTLGEMALRMTLEGPAPSPDRWQMVWSGPEPPIEEVHPAPLQNGGLLKPAKQDPWTDTPTMRSMAGTTGKGTRGKSRSKR